MGELSMSRITIKKNDRLTTDRPCWIHIRPNVGDWPGQENALLEMIESLRNVAEEIREELKRLNGVMQCRNTIRIPAILDKIAANTRKPARRKKAVRA